MSRDISGALRRVRGVECRSLPLLRAIVPLRRRRRRLVSAGAAQAARVTQGGAVGAGQRGAAQAARVTQGGAGSAGDAG
ncbi:hypothetical protein, partial [Streptomyces europaeiscabiei]|uniref:hypothetical protein n=1 Tax=Streptomyces europaeiscabiei TaxID=146819 RepID=UPI0029A2C550|nr:hypothetical protein [Streptomyces europaeiscabiei]